MKLWDARKLGRGKKAAPLATLLEPGERSVNSANFSPGGDRIVSVTQSNHLRLYVDAHKATGDVAPTHSVRHDNKTGRYLAVFHSQWDPKTEHSFVVGSMMKPRQVEVYTTEKGRLRRIMSLQNPEWLGSVQSRCAFHPRNDALVCANSSGRVHVFR